MKQPRWLGMLVRFAIIVAAVCVGPMVPARACLWDSDTLRMEAKAFPGLAEILTGRIERFPARYYQMRLERVEALVKQQPDVLEHYDDLGVACDRLGRSDEAVEWMRRKLEAMKGLPESAPLKEHRYRYHANLGTFLAHRWLRAGAKGASADELADLKAGRDEIKAAIAINPDAHFGRERSQLAAMEWLMSVRSEMPGEYISILEYGVDVQGVRFDSAAREKLLDDSVKGLSGLIVLGDAWQSIDVHFALEQALRARSDTSLAELAMLRRRELQAQGAKSLHIGYTSVSEEPARSHLFLGAQITEGERDAIASYFDEARKAAVTWTQARTAFMNSRFDQGLHPDTHGDAFWSGWDDGPRAPLLPDPGIYGRLNRETKVGIQIAIGMMVLLVGMIGWRVTQRRRLKASMRSMRG